MCVTGGFLRFRTAQYCLRIITECGWHFYTGLGVQHRRTRTCVFEQPTAVGRLPLYMTSRHIYTFSKSPPSSVYHYRARWTLLCGYKEFNAAGTSPPRAASTFMRFRADQRRQSMTTTGGCWDRSPFSTRSRGTGAVSASMAFMARRKSSGPEMGQSRLTCVL